MAIFITGAAGFIGMHVAAKLLARGEKVVGLDDLNDYYSVVLKRDRVARLQSKWPQHFHFVHADFSDATALNEALDERAFHSVIHLGAQPGVRYSLENPARYIQSNLVGHANVMELARQRGVTHFVYASSSSVYGGNQTLPFSVDDRADHPLSLYAATKRADELITETCAHVHRLPSTGLRFFTVYGPWGRPDMAPWLFTAAILKGEPITVYNEGRMQRDFTYIDDIVDGVVACVDRPPADDGSTKPGGSRAPHALYNLGNSRAVVLDDFVELLERACGRRAIRVPKSMQPGDVVATCADIELSRQNFGFAPTTPIEEGLPRFVEWYRRYVGI